MQQMLSASRRNARGAPDARAIGDEASRFRALAALVPLLDDAPRQAVLVEALATAKAIGDEASRSTALALMAPDLDLAQREAVLAEATAAAKAIRRELPRCYSLAALVKHASVAEGRELMQPLLDTVATVARSAALQAAESAAALTHNLGGETAVADLRSAINDVCRWYP